MTEFKYKKEWDELSKDYIKNRQKLWDLFYNYCIENEAEIIDAIFGFSKLDDIKNVPYGKRSN